MNYKLEPRELPFVASTKFKTLSPTPHIHRHIELLYLLDGQSSVVADKKTGFLVPGDVYLAFPNQIHYFDDVPARGYIFIVLPDLFPDLLDIFINKVPDQPIIRKQDLPSDIESRLEKIHFCANSPHWLQYIAAKGHMQALLADLLQKMILSDANSNNDSVKQVLCYCTEHYTEPLTLDVLSRELHLSKHYISHVFTERLRVSFPDFINDLRVKHACKYLKKGCCITDVAFSAGFNSVRSFNRNFKRSKGISPLAYIKSQNS